MVTKRIIFVANSDLSHDQRMQRICRSLHAAGYAVLLLGRAFQNSSPLTSEPYEQERINLWFQKGKLSYLELNIRFFIKIWKLNADAICSVDLDTLPACWLWAQHRNKLLIHDAHELMEEVPEVYNRPFTKKIWQLLAHLLLPRVNLAYASTASIAQFLSEKYCKHFHTIQNIALLEPESENAHKPEIGGYWVYLGAVNQGRGLEEFLEVLPATGRKLMILGDGDRMAAVKELIKAKNLEDWVDVKGKVLPEEARKWLAGAWAGINLLRDEGLSYRYSLANKFFDYTHAGIPQICVNFQEYATKMKEFEVGYLCDMQPENILRATEEISKPEKQRQYRENAAKARQIWNWQNEEQKLLVLYEKLFQAGN